MRLLFQYGFYLSLLLSIQSIKAQQPTYKHYTVEDGLAGSTVYEIFQDSKEFIWIGTANGVSRFDGTKFQIPWHRLSWFLSRAFPGYLPSAIILPHRNIARQG